MMLSEEFKEERARHVCELAEKAIDPFIRQRLLYLAERYEQSQQPYSPTATPHDLEFVSRGNGSER